MAVLPGPPARHVRRPGEAITIVEIGESALPPREARGSGRVGIALALAVGVIGVAFIGTMRAAPIPVRTPGSVPPTAPSSSAAAAPTSTAVPLGWWTYLSDQRQLDLPAGSGDAVLTSMPDRYLNDPLPAAFRVPVTVRGTTGIAAAGPPAALIWTEGDLSYSISSPTLTISQLIDLASALR